MNDSFSSSLFAFFDAPFRGDPAQHLAVVSRFTTRSKNSKCSLGPFVFRVDGWRQIGRRVIDLAAAGLFDLVHEGGSIIALGIGQRVGLALVIPAFWI